MMNRSNTVSPARAFTILSPATRTAIGWSLGPNVPTNLNGISGGAGVGGGGGGGHGPRNSGSPQTGGGGGAGVGVGKGVGAGKSKILREPELVLGGAASRSLRLISGTSSALTFFASARARPRATLSSGSEPPEVAARAAAGRAVAGSLRPDRTRART